MVLTRLLQQKWLISSLIEITIHTSILPTWQRVAAIWGWSKALENQAERKTGTCQTRERGVCLKCTGLCLLPECVYSFFLVLLDAFSSQNKRSLSLYTFLFYTLMGLVPVPGGPGSSSFCFSCLARCSFRLFPNFRWDALWDIYSNVTLPYYRNVYLVANIRYCSGFLPIRLKKGLSVTPFVSPNHCSVVLSQIST